MRDIEDILNDMKSLNVTPATLQQEIAALESEVYDYITKEARAND